MAHNISFNEITEQHSFFSVRQTAWHGLGKIVQDYPTSAQAVAFAGLDYEVIKAPIVAKGESLVESYPIPDQFATMRSDTNAVFGVVGKDYQIVQNADAFAFFDAIVGGGDGILYETAGALGNGDDITEKYIVRP